MAKLERRPWRRGLIKSQPTAACVAASTPVTLYTMPTNRTGIIRGLHIFNGNAAPTRVQIGTGTAPFVQQFEFYAVNGMDLELKEEDIPEIEFTTTITVQATAAAAAPNQVQVTPTVEEFLGISG